MMILFDIFIKFLKVGLFSFGGAYSAIPLIKDIVVNNNWISAEIYTDMVAVAESTPGPLMVNIATYVGLLKGGLLGSVMATLASILPSYLTIVVLVVYFKKFLEDKKVKYALSIIRPAVVGVIFAAGIELLFKNVLIDINIESIYNLKNYVLSNYTDIIKKVIILLILALSRIIYKKIKHKKFNSILFLIFSAVLGIIIYMF